jgi:hypothetical protein
MNTNILDQSVVFVFKSVQSHYSTLRKEAVGSSETWVPTYKGNNNNNNNNGSTALYGPLPPLFEVTKSCAFVAVGDWPTSRATVSIDPDVSARAIWQAVRRLGWEMELTKRFYSCPWDRRKWCSGFLSPLKNPSNSVGIEPANLGSSGKHANH